MPGPEFLRELAPGLVCIKEPPLSLDHRLAIADRIGRKASGLAIIPPAWTPPFVVIEAGIYREWCEADSRRAKEIISSIASLAAQEARKWPEQWDRGVTVRSSATDETLSERGSNESVELAADFDGPMVARAVLQIFQSFKTDDAPGSMAAIVQARVAHLALGHVSNEQRVSKTINQWMWEYEPADRDGGRFNSQRESAPDILRELKPASGKSSALIKLFRQIGRWCTLLQSGRTHLEWGASIDALWLFQIDFEDDQPDTGVDPTGFLRLGDFTPSGTLSTGSPFRLAPTTGGTGWKKIDKIADFVESGDQLSLPPLIYITGDEFLRARLAPEDLSRSLHEFANDRVVCRTDCISKSVGDLNLPRTPTVTSEKALDFMSDVLADFMTKGIPANEVCFILHKFIPAITAAWAVARKGEQLVRVDSLWGLPDGLQYLPHDSYEYDIRRGQQSAERPQHKPAFLQETQTGAWEVVRVARRATRWRSLPAPDLAYVAQRTADIAERVGNDIQIMWFCQIPEATGLPRNIPWFSMRPAEQLARSASLSPAKRRMPIRSMSDLAQAQSIERGKVVLQLDPDDPELFRSTDFTEEVIRVARAGNFPVALTGSVLGHAFYVIEKSGVPVTALNEPTRSRTRQRRIFRKIVRDEIPEKITEGGETVTLAEIAKEETRAALVGKLFEESYELLAADTPQDVAAELADLLEVVIALASATGIDWREVEKAAGEKRASRGGFEKNIVLLETSWPGLLTENRRSSSFTIPLKALGQIVEKNNHLTIPFPALLAEGGSPTIRLENGSEFEISLTGNGVEIRKISDTPSPEEQSSFDF